MTSVGGTCHAILSSLKFACKPFYLKSWSSDVGLGRSRVKISCWRPIIL